MWSQDLMKEEEKVEVIFVSADGSPDELMKYFKDCHGDWLAVQHGAMLGEQLTSKYNVSGGIPSLVVVAAADGRVLSATGRSDVTDNRGLAYQQWLAKAL